jgi:hypothetical protein
MEIKPSVSRDVTRTDTFGVQTAELVTVIRPCTTCATAGLLIYLPENTRLCLSILTLNTDLTFAVLTSVRYFPRPKTCSTHEKETCIYIYIFVAARRQKRSLLTDLGLEESILLQQTFNTCGVRGGIDSSIGTEYSDSLLCTR